MTISGYTSLTETSGISQAQGQQTERSPRGAGNVSDRTRLHHSAQAQQLTDSLNQLPETRTDRVNAVRQSMRDGSMPSDGQIADAIVADWTS